jgi:glycosyltransferase involved in cell wall biosynthesis
MVKKKILFVVAGFYRAGAERFAYEIDAALNKGEFEVTILCLEEKSSINLQWGNRYYEDKHKNLDTEIMFIDSFLKKKTFLNKVVNKINKKIFNKKVVQYNSKINDFFLKFDLIHWMGEYTFLHFLSEDIRKKSLINIMSAKFQNVNIYWRFDFDYKYNFISGYDENESEYEYNEFREINHRYLPLLFKIPFQVNKWKFKQTATIKIGIFTRLSRHKPLDPFFYSFQLILERLPNCELHIYGNGNPEEEGMIRYLKTLGIRDKVFFRGHQENIVDTVIDEQINLSWFQGYNNDRPAGYAGFDICSTGTPLICWEFLENPTKPFNEVYPHYKTLTQFVEKSYEILTCSDSANKLSEFQFKDVIENRDVNKHINTLESIYREILDLNK